MSTTDDQHTNLASADEWAHVVTRALNDQRARTRRFLQRQQERFVELHGQLVAQPGESVAPRPTGGQSAGADQSEQQYDDLRRRFEMAVEDVRELKAQNAELEQRREHGTDARASIPTEVPAGGLDWEAQKQRLMAELEGFDDEDEAQDKLTIEGAIRITDQVVAEKEQQLEQLKAQLERRPVEEDQSRAVAGLLDADEVIRQEREKLRLLQEDWQDKLRKAEIEISVERAKLARERSSMEEQIQSYQAQLAQLSAAENSSPETGSSKKSSRGNWLSRLGLTGDD